VYANLSLLVGEEEMKHVQNLIILAYLVKASCMQLQKEHIVCQQEITSKNVHTCEIPQREGNRLA
jgi:hypothetical protein